MSDLIRRSDVKRCYEKFFSERLNSGRTFSINDVFDRIDNIKSVPALELNEDLTILLKQLGYEKVTHCKECLKKCTKYCKFYDFTKIPTADDFYCGCLCCKNAYGKHCHEHENCQ